MAPEGRGVAWREGIFRKHNDGGLGIFYGGAINLIPMRAVGHDAAAKWRCGGSIHVFKGD
jgi:hypothetical protein